MVFPQTGGAQNNDFLHLRMMAKDPAQGLGLVVVVLLRLLEKQIRKLFLQCLGQRIQVTDYSQGPPVRITAQVLGKSSVAADDAFG